VRVREQFYRRERRRLKSRQGRREVPLSPGMAERLRQHRRDAYRGDTAPVFASASGRELHPSNVASRVLKPAAQAAGLLAPEGTWSDPARPEGWVSLHTCRHTCASLLFDAAKNVKQVQEWLGHADPGFTMRRYIHLIDGGQGPADFLAEKVKGGNRRATQRPETATNAQIDELTESAL